MKIYHHLLLSLSLLLSTLSVTARTPHEVPNVHLQRATSWVSDPDAILSPTARAQADSLLHSLNTSLTTEVTAVVVADLSDIDINTWATDLYEQWGIGHDDRDNGLLIVISRDDRQAVLRTGYGMEGVINDARAGRIIRNNIAPAMKDGNPDKALLDAISGVAEFISTPEAAEYLHSDQRPSRPDDDIDLFALWLYLGGFAGAGLLIAILASFLKGRRQPDNVRWLQLDKLRRTSLIATFMSLGMALPAFLLAWWLSHRVRRHPHYCPNCSTRMNLVDEVHDNDYLTPAQDAEEQLNSVDYDVWLCPNCNETDIIPYENSSAQYTHCSRCGARAMMKEGERILQRPTDYREGHGIRLYRCRNCGDTASIPFTIAKTVTPPIVVGGGGFGSGGGGGFSGGSFGGGSTGGGGASGGW